MILLVKTWVLVTAEAIASISSCRETIKTVAESCLATMNHSANSLNGLGRKCALATPTLLQGISGAPFAPLGKINNFPKITSTETMCYMWIIGATRLLTNTF